jgi:hypothetical protein
LFRFNGMTPLGGQFRDKGNGYVGTRPRHLPEMANIAGVRAVGSMIVPRQESGGDQQARQDQARQTEFPFSGGTVKHYRLSKL